MGSADAIPTGEDRFTFPLGWGIMGSLPHKEYIVTREELAILKQAHALISKLIANPVVSDGLEDETSSDFLCRAFIEELVCRGWKAGEKFTTKQVQEKFEIPYEVSDKFTHLIRYHNSDPLVMLGKVLSHVSTREVVPGCAFKLRRYSANGSSVYKLLSANSR